MADLIVYFGLPEFILLLLLVLLGAGSTGWALGQRKQHQLQSWVTEFLDALPHGAVIAQADGRVMLTNAEAQQMWAGESFSKHLPDSLISLTREADKIQGHSVRNLEAPSGLTLRVRATRLQPGLILLILQDVTAQQQQDAFYRNFISNVSHELKTPLTVIQGHVAALGEGLAADDPRQTSSYAVAQETARLTQLVDNLLLLSRLEMPDFNLDRRPVNLEAVIEDAIIQLSDLAEARDISIGVQRTSALPRIAGDRARLKQVFINLLDNAIKYNHQGGAVKVNLGTSEAGVVVHIIDTGEGIPAQDLPHIFEKMYRVERRRGRYVEGSGLGLSIVQRIVEQHGGNVSVESQIGTGSSFTVILPRSSG